MEGNFTIILNDGKITKLSKKAADLSEMLKGMKIIAEEQQIPLETDSNTFEKIKEYLEHFDGNSPPEIQKPLKSTDMKNNTDEWSANFVDKLTIKELANLISASHLIHINSLLNLCCATLVSLCKGKSEEEIFKTFGVPENYFTPEKKEQIKENNKWIEGIFQ